MMLWRLYTRIYMTTRYAHGLHKEVEFPAIKIAHTHVYRRISLESLQRVSRCTFPRVSRKHRYDIA